MNKAELGIQIYDAAYVIGRNFRLRSGTTSNEYFDKYQFESNPALLKALAEHMASLLPPKTEVLAGLEMGGIPISTALSLYTGLPQVLVRKEAKKYGTEKIAEGINVSGRNLTLIEDVITTGGQINLSANQLREMDANVEYALSVIERNPQGRYNLQENNIELITLFTAKELRKYCLA